MEESGTPKDGYPESISRACHKGIPGFHVTIVLTASFLGRRHSQNPQWEQGVGKELQRPSLKNSADVETLKNRAISHGMWHFQI